MGRRTLRDRSSGESRDSLADPDARREELPIQCRECGNKSSKLYQHQRPEEDTCPCPECGTETRHDVGHAQVE